MRVESHYGAGSAEAIQALGFAALVLVIIGIMMFCISMLADCQERRFDKRELKKRWTLLILFVPLIGAIIYYYRGRSQGTKPPPAFPRYY